MSTNIYYFSGTGNSLVAARDIAARMSGQLISISSVMDKMSIQADADVIGIVFPVYFATNDNGGVPLIVERFIGKMENLGPKYIFAVCTHGGMPGTTIEHLSKIIRAHGGKLSAGFTVKMNEPPSSVEKLQKLLFHTDLKYADAVLATKRQQKMSVNWKNKLDIIIDHVNAKREGHYETRGILTKLLFSPLLLIIKPMFSSRYQKLANTPRKSFNELIPLSDSSFLYDEKCNGCGICSRICPVGNIKMVEKKPVWQHHCENCIACYVWCPMEAICGDIVSYNERYHHPDVKLAEMLRHN